MEGDYSFELRVLIRVPVIDGFEFAPVIVVAK